MADTKIKWTDAPVRIKVWLARGWHCVAGFRKQSQAVAFCDRALRFTNWDTVQPGVARMTSPGLTHVPTREHVCRECRGTFKSTPFRSHYCDKRLCQIARRAARKAWLREYRAEKRSNHADV